MIADLINVHIPLIQKPDLLGEAEQTLADKLREAGFKEVRQWDPDDVPNHDFRDWANSDILVNGRVFPVSLNLEAIK